MRLPRESFKWTRYGARKQFFVYVMSNESMTLYVGTTSDLRSRSNAHKSGRGSAFTSRYHFDRLVYFEVFESPEQAIAREKTLKGWSRAKKIALIKTANPSWIDLLERL